jgi:hypothetical protein
MPTTPLIAATFAASRVTCFGPEQDCARLAATVTTINQAGISRDPRRCGRIFPNEADWRARCLLSHGACGRSPRGQRCSCAREQPRGRVRHRRQLRGPPPPDLGLSLNRPAHRPRPGRSVLCRWKGRPQRGVWITRFGDRCGARIAKRNTSQDLRSVTSVMIRVPGID